MRLPLLPPSSFSLHVSIQLPPFFLQPSTQEATCACMRPQCQVTANCGHPCFTCARLPPVARMNRHTMASSGASCSSSRGLSCARTLAMSSRLTSKSWHSWQALPFLGFFPASAMGDSVAESVTVLLDEDSTLSAISSLDTSPGLAPEPKTLSTSSLMPGRCPPCFERLGCFCMCSLSKPEVIPPSSPVDCCIRPTLS